MTNHPNRNRHHTPGPWESVDGHGRLGRDIRTEDLNRRDSLIAQVYGSSADAALLAAAPELLEVAKLCHAALLALPIGMQPDSDTRDISLSGHLREVIAKAECI